jgi:ribonuclease R
MLAANESVSSYLEGKNVPSLYRVHEKPDPKRVFDFENVAVAFGYSLGIGALPVKKMTMKAERRDKRHTGREPRLFEIPEDVHITPRMYQKLTQKIAGSPMERILSYLMLRSLKQARYSEENVGHFALATGTYTHFTSPIRRYPDLIVHRILKQVLMESAEQWDGAIPVGIGKTSTKKGAWERSAQAEAESRRDRLGRGKSVKREEAQNGPISLDVLHDIAEETSATERHAADAERELLEWKKIKFMQDHVGEEFTGLIISVTKFGFFVELTDLFIEGLVPLSSLVDDRYVFNDRTKQIIAQRTHKQYSLGDQVRVMVDRIDPVLHKINFMVITDEPQKRPRKSQRRKSFL